MRVSTTSLVLLAVLLCLSGTSFTADKKKLEAALAAVEANLKTSAGKQYDELLGKELVARYFASIKQCRQSLPAASRVDPFDMFLKLRSDGQVVDALIYPESQLAFCSRDVLSTARFSNPPHDEYWINVHVQLK